MVLKLENIHKRFGKNIALDNLNLMIPSNEIFGFLGSNGAGKTTTFRMILGLIEPTTGSICWKDRPITNHMKQKIGYLPEMRGLYEKLTVKEQLIYFGRLKGQSKKETLDIVDYWLERLQIPHYINKKLEELSKGNQQKIQFIVSVLHRPKLLILDEPFSGLDPFNVELMKQAMIDLKKLGTTIIFSSHQMAHVEQLCESLCILQNGKVVVQGNLNKIKEDFGKKNLVIEANFSLHYLKSFSEVLKFQETLHGCKLQIPSIDSAQEIFKSLVGRGTIKKFAIEEPTLNEIFIEKVGMSYE